LRGKGEKALDCADDQIIERGGSFSFEKEESDTRAKGRGRERAQGVTRITELSERVDKLHS